MAWAVAYALKTYDLEVRTHSPLVRPDGLPDLTRHFSPAFVYNQINHGHDGGSSYIDALRL
ncbi:MAG TPA: hypothetical protein VFS44_02560, partial [Gemmatimonadaceae bacterium]|nr:hypothetical protein [Gemmatimonadaceae bacterium]